MASNFLKSTSTSSATTQNLLELLGDLAQSRITVERDQKAYEHGRQELTAVNSKLKQLSQRKESVQKQIADGEMAFAQQAAELSLAQIKEKVLVEGVKKLQADVVIGWDRLREIRSRTSSVSSRFLSECSNFAMMYNCTELGAQKRTKALDEELEEMRLQKHQMEYDLQKFLSMLKEVEKSEKENKELEQQYRAQEAADRSKEMEAYNKLSESEKLLDQLEKKKALMEKQLQEDMNKLQSKLQNTKQTISYWERRVSENQRIVSHQKNPISTYTVSSATSPGFPPMTSSIQLGNGQSVITNNKSARISQYVRPTPQVSKPNSREPHASKPPARAIQSKLQFTNSVNPSLSFVKPTKPKFTSPFVSKAIPPPSRAPTSVCAPPLPKTNPVQQNQENDDDDPFNDSFSSSQYFCMPNTSNAPSLSTSSYNNSSNQSNNSYLNSNNSSSFTAGRTFQFKKKSLEENPTCITGPTCRSMPVTLGTTPFSTFQNSRNVLQEKQQQLQETPDFQHGMDMTPDYG